MYSARQTTIHKPVKCHGIYQKENTKKPKMGAPASLADINSVLSKLVATCDNHSLDKDINLVLPIISSRPPRGQPGPGILPSKKSSMYNPRQGPGFPLRKIRGQLLGQLRRDKTTRQLPIGRVEKKRAVSAVTIFNSHKSLINPILRMRPREQQLWQRQRLQNMLDGYLEGHLDQLYGTCRLCPLG